MRILKTHVLLRLLNSYLVDSPQPANLSYLWNFGSLLAICLIIQILTGAFLAMHYTPNVDFAFNSVEHIMRDVNNGWILRYTHANVASFFFIFVYMHIGRGLYYGSYKSPRVLVWSIGVVIFILMMAIGFLGYVLPYGQMSLWGYLKLAPHIYFLISNYISLKECQDILFYLFKSTCVEAKGEDNLTIATAIINSLISTFNYTNQDLLAKAKGNFNFNWNNEEIKIQKIRANLRIGPHNKNIISILFGSLLGDAHAEFRLKGNGTRITFFQEGSHVSYLIWLHKLISELGYCNTNLPKITTRLGKKGVVRKIIRFNTWTYSSFNWIHESFYKNGKIKCVPNNIAEYLTPLSLAIWIMDDGGKVGQGLKLSTNSFSFSDCNFLVKVLYDKFKLKASVQSAGVENQYIIYIWKDSMPLLREIVLPYVHPSMKYKLINK